MSSSSSRPLRASRKQATAAIASSAGASTRARSPARKRKKLTAPPPPPVSSDEEAPPSVQEIVEALGGKEKVFTKSWEARVRRDLHKGEKSVKCAMCGIRMDTSVDPFLGPYALKKRRWFLHPECALWCRDVDADDSIPRGIHNALARLMLKCYLCRESGGAIRCQLKSCRNSFHYPCAVYHKCAFIGDFKHIYCTEHKNYAELPGEDNEQIFIVDHIIRHRIGYKRKKQYLVKWKGYPDSEATWEPESSFVNKDVLRAYHAQLNGQKFEPAASSGEGSSSSSSSGDGNNEEDGNSSSSGSSSSESNDDINTFGDDDDDEDEDGDGGSRDMVADAAAVATASSIGHGVNESANILKLGGDYSYLYQNNTHNHHHHSDMDDEDDEDGDVTMTEPIDGVNATTTTATAAAAAATTTIDQPSSSAFVSSSHGNGGGSMGAAVSGSVTIGRDDALRMLRANAHTLKTWPHWGDGHVLDATDYMLANHTAANNTAHERLRDEQQQQQRRQQSSSSSSSSSATAMLLFGEENLNNDEREDDDAEAEAKADTEADLTKKQRSSSSSLLTVNAPVQELVDVDRLLASDFLDSFQCIYQRNDTGHEDDYLVTVRCIGPLGFPSSRQPQRRQQPPQQPPASESIPSSQQNEEIVAAGGGGGGGGGCDDDDGNNATNTDATIMTETVDIALGAHNDLLLTGEYINQHFIARKDIITTATSVPFEQCDQTLRGRFVRVLVTKPLLKPEGQVQQQQQQQQQQEVVAGANEATSYGCGQIVTVKRTANEYKCADHDGGGGVSVELEVCMGIGGAVKCIRVYECMNDIFQDPSEMVAWISHVFPTPSSSSSSPSAAPPLPPPQEQSIVA